MGTFKFTSWAIHMIMLVLFSNIVGIVLREWRACRRLTHQAITFALLVLVGAVLSLTYGNKIGDDAEQKAKLEKEAHETLRNGDRPPAGENR